MSKIHSTAVIESGAQIDEDVEIGPYSLISRQARIHSGTKIAGHVCVAGRTTIGKNNELHFSCYLGGPPQHLSFIPGNHSRLQIGDNNIFREFSQVHCSMLCNDSSKTFIGNHNYLMTQSHVGHDVKMGNHNILVQASVLGGHCILGNYVTIGGMTGVHQWVRLGSYCMIGGMAKVTQDVPPYVMVDGGSAKIYGLNSIGLRRNGFSLGERSIIKKVYQIFFVQERSNKQKGLARIKKEIISELAANSTELSRVQEFVDFLEQESKRGILHINIRKKDSTN